MYTKEKISTFQERFSELINETTERKEVSETDIARELSVAKQTLSSWKSGKRSPTKPTVQTVAQYFHVNVDWIMGYDVEKYESDHETQKMPQTEEGIYAGLFMDSLSPEDRSRAIELLKVAFEDRQNKKHKEGDNL